jgi:hypothetical protein
MAQGFALEVFAAKLRVPVKAQRMRAQPAVSQSRGTSLRGAGKTAAAPAAAAASRAAVRSASGWRTSGGTRYPRKIHPRSPSWPFGSLLVALINRPRILQSPLAPQPGGLLSLILVGLHSKWRDVIPFGYILNARYARYARFGGLLIAK